MAGMTQKAGWILKAWPLGCTKSSTHMPKTDAEALDGSGSHWIRGLGD